MRALLIVAALSFLASAAPIAGEARPGTVERAACSAGPHKVKVAGQDAIKFCGSAKATVHAGSKTFHFSNGNCQIASGYFTVNIGTAASPTFKGTKPDYFGITAEKAKAGTQANVAIALRSGGKDYLVVRSSLKLAGGLKKGTFTAQVVFTHAKVSGSFSC